MPRWHSLVVLAVAIPSVVLAQGRDSDFNWAERMSSGAWLRIHTVHGDIRVVEGSGDRAEVIGRKRGDDAAEMRVNAVRSGDDVTICAVWEGGQCDAEGITTTRKSWREGDAMVDFEVRLPRGVHIRAASGHGDVSVNGAHAEVHAASGNGEITVASSGGPVRASSGNGDIDVSQAGGEVVARSGNGDVRVTTRRGPVSAYSGNGSIDARMTTVSGTEDMTFRTGNGNITVELPASFEGQIDARLPNGRLESDFPLRVEGRLDPRRLRATIGRGGPRVTIVSGSGGAAIRKGA